ncbi:hypothetical protein ACFOHM_21380, partial [Microbaculum marinum]
MKHVLTIMVAVLAIAAAGSVSASTGGALACPTGLGDTCAAAGAEAANPLGPRPAPVQLAAG